MNNNRSGTNKVLCKILFSTFVHSKPKQIQLI